MVVIFVWHSFVLVTSVGIELWFHVACVGGVELTFGHDMILNTPLVAFWEAIVKGYLYGPAWGANQYL